MQDQTNETVSEHDRKTQHTILMLLLIEAQAVWSVDELVAEIGRELETKDALDQLKAAGLVHRCGEFVFASRAAIKLDGIFQE
jgi:coproporphyrinogen III oxidase-like Fe-S oxidoreductase